MDAFFTDELIGGLAGGLVVALGLIVFRGLAWLKDFVMGTPTKIDDKAFNMLVKRVIEVGEIPLEPISDPPSEREAPATGQARQGREAKPGSIMRSPAAAAAVAALLVLALPGCDPAKWIPTGGVIQTGEEAEEGTAQKQLADQLFGVIDGKEGRTARLALVVATYTELAADRVVRFDPDQATETLGRFAELRGVLDRFAGASDTVFVETDLRHASLAIASVVLDTGIDRARNLAGNVLTLDPSGLAERGRVGLRQAAFIEALLADVRAAVARMREDPGSIAEVDAAARARIDANEARIRALLGAPALPASPPPVAPRPVV
ncbi:MAG TPA: hypothetical protein EYP07_05700 [Kiloniellaceae bacterium]|nr:hypothetical protein [Kiloniellaceae bacterium]